MGLQALCAISMTSCDEGVCSGLRTGETGGSLASQPLSWSSWCELVAVQMSASSSGSSKKPGVASGGGWPNLGLWGRRPGLGGDIIILLGVSLRAFPPLFFRGPAHGARCSRGSWGPYLASRRGLSAGAASADAGGGDLAARAPSLILLRSRDARPRNSLWVLRTSQATVPNGRYVWRGGAGGFPDRESRSLGELGGYICFS